MFTMQANELTERIIDSLFTNGGGTLPATRYYPAPVTGYAVAYAGGLEVDSWQYGSNGTRAEIETFVADNIGTVVYWPRHFFGSWQDDNGRIYIDVVRVECERAVAETFAKANNQRAIYNLATREVIYLPTVSLEKSPVEYRVKLGKKVNYVHKGRTTAKKVSYVHPAR